MSKCLVNLIRANEQFKKKKHCKTNHIQYYLLDKYFNNLPRQLHFYMYKFILKPGLAFIEEI